MGLGFKQQQPQDDKAKDKGDAKIDVDFLVRNWSQMLSVPGTMWMISYVMFYKLCERGEGTLPLYLVDKKVSVSSLAFWNGIVR